MNGDVTVKCGGVTKFKENGSNNNSGISFNSENNTLTIEADDQVDLNKIKDAINKAGYSAK
jgi:hypothetical protein